MTKSRIMFGKFAKYYDKASFAIGRMHRKAIPYLDLKEKDFALDVGCGTGELSIYLADATKADIVGLDLSAQMLSEAGRKQKPENVMFVKADASIIPFPEDSFDLAFSTLAMHHMPKLGVLKEMWRVLKKGKKIVIADMVDEGIIGKFAKITEEASFEDVEVVKKKEMIRLLKEAGFKDIHSHKGYSFFYIFEARK